MRVLQGWGEVCKGEPVGTGQLKLGWSSGVQARQQIIELGGKVSTILPAHLLHRAVVTALAEPAWVVDHHRFPLALCYLGLADQKAS